MTTQHLLSDDRKIVRFGIGIIIGTFFILGGWASFAPLASTAVAMGFVSADLNKKIVQHLEGGIVEEILVKNGDDVSDGQELIRFKNTNVTSQLEFLQKQYAELRAIESRLESQIKNAFVFTESDALKEIPRTSSFTNVLNTQKEIFELKQKMLKDDEVITTQRIAQLEKYKEGVTSLIQSKALRLKSIEEEMREWEILFAKKLVDKIKLRELSREKTSLEGDFANAKADIAKANEQISELKSQLLIRKKETQDKVYTELVSTKNSIAELGSKLLTYRDIQKRLLVKAPTSGTIVGMELHTQGGVIPPGERILDIVPKNSPLIVVAHLNPKDIDKVHSGLLADVRFSAFNTRHTHVLEGKVINVSADNLIDKKSGMAYYETKIALTDKGLEQLKNYNFDLVAGMPVEVFIKIEDRTMMNYLLKPFFDMFARSFNEE